MKDVATQSQPAGVAAADEDAGPPQPAPADALTVTLTARTDGEWGEPDAAPADVRLRRGLKELYRRFGLRAAWAEPSPCAVCPLAAAARGRGARK